MPITARPPPRITIFVVVLAVIALLLGWWSRQSTVDSMPAVSSTAPSINNAPVTLVGQSPTPSQPLPVAPHASATSVTRAPGLPASLQGSQPDGEVSFDAQGRVVASADLRRLFDYFLSTIGELDLPAIRALLMAHVRHLHGDAAAAQVGAIFDRYVDYQRALSADGSTIPGDLRARLDYAKALRRRHFDAATADAFFAEEEAYAEYTLARMAVARDRALDESERSERLRELEAALPEAQRASLREARTAVVTEEQSRQFDALGVDAAIRHQERADLYGQAAADRLADLDRERAAWSARIAAYTQARTAINADGSRTAVQRQRAIEALLRSSFDVNEARRVQALESIGQL